MLITKSNLSCHNKIGTAIKCWECNSKYDGRCGEDFSNYSVALVDCDQRQNLVAHLDPLDPTVTTEPPKATLCRKTVQTVEGETRIIRGCGWINNTESLKDRVCFHRAGTKEIQMLHCICRTDSCNVANGLEISSFLGLLAMVLLPALPAFFFNN